MSVFDDILVDDAVNAFCGMDEFEESIVYKNKAGVSRTINAIVIRDNTDEVTHGIAQSMSVFVPNHATSGILTTEIDLGGADILIVPWKKGKTPDEKDRHAIVDMPAQDAGGLIFRFNRGATQRGY
jgi:hypothetical protein